MTSICAGCNSNNYEYNDNDKICKICGLINSKDIFLDNPIEFNSTEGYNRCIDYESRYKNCISEYILYLKSIWSKEHISNVFKDSDHFFENGDNKIDHKENVLMLGLIIQYAQNNSLNIDIVQHKKKLNISSKKLYKLLRHMNIGMVSYNNDKDENDINDKDANDINDKDANDINDKDENDINDKDENYGVIHKLTINFSEKIRENILEIYKHILIHSSIYTIEGETMTSIVTIYLVGKKIKQYRTMKEFCNKTRLTSTPTLSKILRKYELIDIIYPFLEKI